MKDRQYLLSLITNATPADYPNIEASAPDLDYLEKLAALLDAYTTYHRQRTEYSQTHASASAKAAKRYCQTRKAQGYDPNYKTLEAIR